MSLSNTPEQIRTKATRSRCLRSMFAWILNTNPEIPRATGCTTPPPSVWRGCGGGASVSSASRTASTPKLSSALPKSTGVCRPARYSRLVERRAGAGDQPRCRRSAPGAARGPATRPAADPTRWWCAPERGTRHPAPARRAAFRGDQVEDAAETIAAANRPVQRGGMDAEHVLDLLQQVERVAAGQVELVDERDDRQWRSRGTSNSLRVWVSMPLAASITITALSTA